VVRSANELREVPVDHPDLSRGWHVVERDGIALRRWTSGDAVLPLPVLGGARMLEIRAGSGGMTYLSGGAQVHREAGDRVRPCSPSPLWGGEGRCGCADATARPRPPQVPAPRGSGLRS